MVLALQAAVPEVLLLSCRLCLIATKFPFWPQIWPQISPYLFHFSVAFGNTGACDVRIATLKAVTALDNRLLLWWPLYLMGRWDYSPQALVKSKQEMFATTQGNIHSAESLWLSFKYRIFLKTASLTFSRFLSVAYLCYFISWPCSEIKEIIQGTVSDSCSATCWRRNFIKRNLLEVF